MDCVILVHGIGRTRFSMKSLESRFVKNNYRVINWSYQSTKKDITSIAENLHAIYSLHASDNDSIHFVTHSMGGLVLRRLLRLHKLPKLGKIVMIAPPNNGSESARRFFHHKFINFIFGPAAQELSDGDYINSMCETPEKGVMVIAGSRSMDIKNPLSLLTTHFLSKPNDGTVTVEETKLEAMDKFVTINDSHTFIASNPAVINEALNFINA